MYRPVRFLLPSTNLLLICYKGDTSKSMWFDLVESSPEQDRSVPLFPSAFCNSGVQMLTSPAFLMGLIMLLREPKQKSLLFPLLQHLCWRNQVSTRTICLPTRLVCRVCEARRRRQQATWCCRQSKIALRTPDGLLFLSLCDSSVASRTLRLLRSSCRRFSSTTSASASRSLATSMRIYASLDLGLS